MLEEDREIPICSNCKECVLLGASCDGGLNERVKEMS